MNRSILIVICDFLLLSLLTFSTDINHMADENTRTPTQVTVTTNNPAGPGADLAAAMRQALADERQRLEAERQSREQLQQQMAQQSAQTRDAAVQAQAQLNEREQENLRLRRQFTAGQTNLENLSRQLQATSAQAQESQQRLVSLQTEAQRETELAAALQQQLDLLSKSNQLALTEKQRLAGQLQLAEAEKGAAAERAALMQQEVQATRAENTKLAEGFQMLATNSGQLVREIRANQTLSPNTIFTDFVSNRVGVAIFAARTGLFGQAVNRDKNTETIVVSDGTNFSALCHVQDTPLALWVPGIDWARLAGTLTGRTAQVPIHALAFDQQDPRVVFMPLSAAEAHRLGCKIYQLSANPDKFQDAVLIGASEGYYGECNFQIELGLPQYLRLDRSLLRGLFGKFNPSRGDLVFSQAGELLGIMVNNTYCLAIQNFHAAATFPFDADLRTQPTGETLSQFYDSIFDLPPKLQ